VFAAITGVSNGPHSATAGGFAVPNALVRAKLVTTQGRTTPVSTGPCSG